MNEVITVKYLSSACTVGELYKSSHEKAGVPHQCLEAELPCLFTQFTAFPQKADAV